MFERTRGKCLTRDGYVAAGVAARMTFADEGTFWSQFRDRYAMKYGETSLQDARAYAQRCKLVLTIDSEMTYKPAEGISIVYNVNMRFEPLVMRYDSDRQSPSYGPYLTGYGLVFPSRVEVTREGCNHVALIPEPTEFIRVGLQLLIADDGLQFVNLVDFGGGGLRVRLEQQCKPDDPLSVANIQGGNTWGGIYVDARRGNVTFALDDVRRPQPSSGVIASRIFTGSGQGISGATIIETTTIKLILGGG
jgi:hypothetical protein